MNLKILCWNVRGLNAANTQMAVKSYVKGIRANVICLQETKVEGVDRGFVWDIWGGHCRVKIFARLWGVRRDLGVLG